MPKGDKYIDLKNFLINSNQPIIKLSFDNIENILKFELPPSAHIRKEWWSNSYSHSQAFSWLEAGYETDCVSDTYKEKYIVFIKVKSQTHL